MMPPGRPSRAAGMTLRARIDVPGTGPLPGALGRTVYRVIQEGLTNARKHAPGAAVEVTVTTDGQAAPRGRGHQPPSRQRPPTRHGGA